MAGVRCAKTRPGASQATFRRRNDRGDLLTTGTSRFYQ
jgi:hypothetical protein